MTNISNGPTPDELAECLPAGSNAVGPRYLVQAYADDGAQLNIDLCVGMASHVNSAAEVLAMVETPFPVGYRFNPDTDYYTPTVIAKWHVCGLRGGGRYVLDEIHEGSEHTFRQAYYQEHYNLALDTMRDLNPYGMHDQARRYAERKTAALFGPSTVDDFR